MPINYHVKKPMHCSNLDPNLVSSVQGCKFKRDEIPEFKPINRVKGSSSIHKPLVSPTTKQPNIQQIEPMKPVTLGITTNIPLPVNNNGFSIFSNQPTVNEDSETNIAINQETTDDKTDYFNKPNARLQYINEEQRQAHLNSVKKFSEHPNATPRDIFAGEIAQAAYIDHTKQPEIMDEYINKVSSIGEKGYILDPDPLTHNEYMKTFINPRTGDVAVAYRGTVTWIGQDGRANLANTVGVTKARQKIQDVTNVDLRTKKAKILKDTNDYIRNKYGDNVTLTSGHSQGGHDSTQSKRIYHKNADSIVFMPAPGGEVKKGEGKMWATPNDIVSTKGKLYSMFSQNYNMNEIRSTDKSFLNRATFGHMSDNFAASVPTKINEEKITERTPLLNEEKTVEVNPKMNTMKNIGRAGAVTIIPSLIAETLVEQIAPNASDQEKIAMGVTSTALATDAVSRTVGLGKASVVESFLPLYAAFEAGEFTDKGMAAILPSNMNPYEAGAIRGGADGVASTAAYGGTAYAQSRVMSGISKIAQMSRGTTAATAEIGETTPLLSAEGIEAAEAVEAATAAAEAAEAAEAATAALEAVEAAEAAAAAAEAAEAAIVTGEGVAVAAGAAEGAAAGSFLGPVGLLGGLVVGAGLGVGAALWGEHEKKEAKKEAEEARKKADDAQAIRDAALAAEEQIRQEQNERRQQQMLKEKDYDLDYVSNTPQIGTTEQERIDWLAKNAPNYAFDEVFEQLGESNYELAYEKQIQYIVMREQQKIERAGQLYSTLQNDQAFQLALQTKEIPRINQAIKNIVMADQNTYGDFLNNQAALPQLDKDGSWIHTSFDDDNHIWSDSPNDFTAEEPQSELSSLQERQAREAADTSSWSFIYPDNPDNTNNNP